ncbi:hypothetical protein BN7_4536 [Wickerhamomyces ciferrii]|uniref:Uncharacterized protein n=1 Tax=Wickerhamomyces ciferrii (strain ATCC 14091 / BCRC 22168 / CBS 111 / JCM 3599 / NBRC 0793 / NRRL Y-1031 F-60-10) TaxID=1206466 RepID=K0KU61_WICCF|nr:uncharacterized protein BN7_4536 [Wickerhamomyces ciferrii]CCH44959.1 hypothetical protein BN7_4536 [Wickerhamomyces ciferrii]
MLDSLDNLIQLYRHDWEIQKETFKDAKEKTKRQTLIFKDRVETIVGNYRTNAVLDIMDLYINQDHSTRNQPFWMKLIKYNTNYKRRPLIGSSTYKKFKYDATIDDDNQEGLEAGDLLYKAKINKTVSQQLDNVCLELKQYHESDQSSSIYSEVPADKSQYRKIIGDNPYKEEYTYV